MIMQLLKKTFPWGPVLFGIGFVAPVVAQSMSAMELSAPVGLSTIEFGLIVGLAWGSVAKLSGRWV